MLLRTSTNQETRILTRVGLALLIAVLALAGTLAAYRPFGRDRMSGTELTLSTPYVGEGVAHGSPVVLHGAKVGRVAAVDARPGGGAELRLRLQPEWAAGLTDRLGIDFRPANYFGITGVNLIPGPAGGTPLRDGMHLAVTPSGNNTMQTLLARVGELTGGVVTPQLVSVLDRATRYVDGLAPLAETMLLVADTVAAVQSVDAGQLVRNAAGITVATPVFADGVTTMLSRLQHGGLGPELDADFFENRFLATMNLASTGLFGTVGKLASSHADDLLPVTEIVRALTGPIPSIATAPDIAATLVELRTRFERMYEGSGEQRALRVQILLDRLPGVAAPLGIAMGTP